MIQQGPPDPTRTRKPIKAKGGRDPIFPKRLRLDWRAYFRGFCEEHGSPIEHGGKLLFPDGWQYSSSDYQGPEWQPPTDPKELRRLGLAYWSKRRAILRAEARIARTEMESVVALQKVRCGAPLKVKVMRTDDETGERRWEADRINLGDMRQRVEMLEADEAECVQKIEELKAGVARSPFDGKKQDRVT